jgi:hypothetical protein
MRDRAGGALPDRTAIPADDHGSSAARSQYDSDKRPLLGGAYAGERDADFPRTPAPKPSKADGRNFRQTSCSTRRERIRV